MTPQSTSTSINFLKDGAAGAVNNKRKWRSNEPMGLSTAPTPHSSSAPNTTADAAEASTSTVENNNNNNNNSSSTSISNSSTPKDNSTAQLLADLTINFEETISADICLRKTLPDVTLGKEPATPASVLAVATSSAGSCSGLPGDTPPVASAEEELPKIETDNIEGRSMCYSK